MNEMAPDTSNPVPAEPEPLPPAPNAPTRLHVPTFTIYVTPAPDGSGRLAWGCEDCGHSDCGDTSCEFGQQIATHIATCPG